MFGIKIPKKEKKRNIAPNRHRGESMVFMSEFYIAMFTFFQKILINLHAILKLSGL